MSTPIGESRRLSKPWIITLICALLASIVFIIMAALPYFWGDEEKLGRYDGKQTWLQVHIVTGIAALLIGPFQLWLGYTQPRNVIHRRLGMVYLGAIAVSCFSAYYLAFNTDVSFTFGFGLAGLATAWVITCSLAMLAVKRGQFLQHQEWMIRSYVVTFGFVTFRMFMVLLTILNVGSLIDRLNVASWFCWAFPLLLCEAILQGRKCKKINV